MARNRKRSWLRRFLDVRPGERGPLAQAFFTLLLIVAGHTVLEAARDALLLTEMAPTALGSVYLAMAVLALPAGAAVARLGLRMGAQRTLSASTVAAAAVGVVFFVLRATPASAFALYVATGLIGALVVPQFWALAGQIFTVTQGRRLLGPIAAAGLLGGVIGSGLAAAALLYVPVKGILLLAAGLFVLAAFVASLATPQQAVPAGTERRVIPRGARSAFSEEPFVHRIAAVVLLSTAGLLVADYLFKWTVAHTIEPARLGSFFATTYAALNALSLLVQLFVGAALVKRLGVAAAAGVTPMLLLLGVGGALLAGGALAAVMVVKAIDGSLRHSLHRVTTELLYFPLARAVRDRVKPFIDGAAARGAQAATAATLLGLGTAGVLSTRLLLVVAGLLALAWLVVAASLRRSYLAALRRTIAAGELDEQPEVEELDLASVEVLVERLASSEADDVIAALRVLSMRQRDRLIPALVLYHPDENVVAEALRIFSASPRVDWLTLGERLLDDAREGVRSAAAQALARHGHPERLARLSGDPSLQLKAYAAVFTALREAPAAPQEHPALAALVAMTAPSVETLAGLLEALADSPPSPALAEVVATLADRALDVSDLDETVARAAARHADARLLPALLARLPRRAARDAVRPALVALGKPAFDALVAILGDTGQPAALRKHVPQSLARFGTQRAADLLLTTAESDPAGLVRYNALKGLGRIVNENEVRIDRRRVERLAARNLVEHLRLVALRAAIGAPVAPPAAAAAGACAVSVGQLLVGLLEDKREQALERAFRLLQIAYRREDLQRVHWAVRHADARARANASEFVDTLLHRKGQQPLRQLLGAALDDGGSSRLSGVLPIPIPASRSQALLSLMDEPDATLASLAAYYADTLEDAELGAAAARAYRQRPALESQALGLLEVPAPRAEVPAHA